MPNMVYMCRIKIHEALVKENYLLWLTSFHLPYRKASSGLPGMFSTIILGVKVSQEMLSSTIFLLCTDGTNVFLCSWDTVALVGSLF